MITELNREIFKRTIALTGENNFCKIQKATILVVGIGGVGGSCVESLARLGISNIIICDNDVVDITNINRQIIAYNSTIGQKKIDLMHDRISDINPEAILTKLDLKLGESNIEVLDQYKIDYIVDAIDSFDDKIALIKYAKSNNIDIISAMGAGGKLNPLSFKIADYKDTKYCKLAKKLRKTLKELCIKDLKVVYSEENNHYDYSKYNFVSSISFVPPVVGYIIASEVYKDLVKDKENSIEF